MLQFSQSLGLNLTNTLARNVKLLSDLFQRMIGIHTDTETHTQNTFLTRRQRRQNPRAG